MNELVGQVSGNKSTCSRVNHLPSYTWLPEAWPAAARRSHWWSCMPSRHYAATQRYMHYKLEQLERLPSEIPPASPWLPPLGIHIRSQVKTRQSQSYKFKKIAKNSNFAILQETLHATHLLVLLDKMCKYEMDPTRTVGATERTLDAGRTSLENLISAAMKQAAPRTCFFFHVFFI